MHTSPSYPSRGGLGGRRDALSTLSAECDVRRMNRHGNIPYATASNALRRCRERRGDRQRPPRSTTYRHHSRRRDMDEEHHITDDLLMELLIENGPEAMLAVFTAAYNIGMKVERERFIGVGRYERTVGRRAFANGYKPKRIDIPAGKATLSVSKTAGHGARRSARRRFSAADAANRRSWSLRLGCISRVLQPTMSRTC